MYNGTPASNGKPAKAYAFDKDDILEWQKEQIADKHSKSDTHNDALTAAKLRKLNAEASRIELRLQRERNEVVSIDEIGEAYAQELATVRTLLLSIPSKLAPHLAGCDTSTIETELRTAIIECLAELSDAKERQAEPVLAEILEDDEDDE